MQGVLRGLVKHIHANQSKLKSENSYTGVFRNYLSNKSNAVNAATSGCIENLCQIKICKAHVLHRYMYVICIKYSHIPILKKFHVLCV